MPRTAVQQATFEALVGALRRLSGKEADHLEQGLRRGWYVTVEPEAMLEDLARQLRLRRGLFLECDEADEDLEIN